MKKQIINLFLLLMITAGICYAGNLTVESDSQEFKDSDKKIYLEGNVKVKNNDANVLSPRAVVELDPKNNKVNKVEFKDHAYSWQLKDGKKHEIKAQILKMSLLNKVFTAEGNTISSITEKDKPVVIVTADRQEYNKTTNTKIINSQTYMNLVFFFILTSLLGKAHFTKRTKNHYYTA